MNDKEQMGFREWTTHYEKEQEADRAKINALAEGLSVVSQSVSKLSANVEVLLENQKGLFNRMNRPWQWGVVIAAFVAMFTVSGVFATVLSLSLDPIKANMHTMTETHSRDVERNLELHMWFRNSIEEIREHDAEMDARIDWLEKLEKRQNERLHQKYGTQ